jgi:hypothetical protein
MGGITQAQAVLIGGGIGAVIGGLWLWIRAVDWRRATGQPHHVEARRRPRSDRWGLRCRRCGWLRDVPTRTEAFRITNEHHRLFGGGTLVSSRRWWR